MKFLWNHKFKIALVGALLAIGLIFFADWKIKNVATSRLFDHMSEMPHFKVALLLGTSSHLSNGEINNYWLYRIDAAEALLKTGKISHLVISGDNSVASYDEPTEMRQALIDRGIDSSRMTLDYAGFRTLDSVVRIKAVFQQDTALVISQKFHNERAIFLALENEIQAWGFCAQDVDTNFGFKTRCREYLARVNAIMDALFQTEPKFYGDKIHLSIK